MPPSDTSFPDATTLFVEFIRRTDAGEALDFEQLCKSHPEFEADLRRRWEDWQQVRSAMAKIPAGEREKTPGSSDPVRATAAGDSLLDRLCFRDAARYRIEKELARGGMGVVYRVFDRELRRRLAMKVVKPPADEDRAATNQRMIDRFLEEAQITSQLQHPGIVPVHHVGLDEQGRVYFIMPLIRGRDLKQIFEMVFAGSDGWTLIKALHAMIRVCETVAFAHSKGVIHRDLKPSNVMVGRFGETYVMDWGLARAFGRPEQRDLRIRLEESQTVIVHTDRHDSPGSPLFTMDGEVIGTPSYMPPEQAQGRVDLLDKRSDVYSLGAILYHLLCKRMPYASTLEHLSPREILARVSEAPPTPLRELDRDLPEGLVAICEKAMARARAMRYQDALEMARDLEAYLGSRPIMAVPHRIGYLLKLAIKRNKPVATTALAAAALLIALAIFFVTSLKQEVKRTKGALERSQTMVDVLSAGALVSEMDALYPAVPSTVPALESWLARSAALLARAATYEAASQHPADHEPIVAAKLTEMMANLGTLRAAQPAITERLQVARTLAAATIDDVLDLWQEVKNDLAHSPSYMGLELEPQLGLVPLRKNPDNGLWEFWHVLSGTEPLTDGEGEPQITEQSGIVLVLLPGGSYLMGSPESERDHQPNERVHKVTLLPFFISKYETTQAQWQRLMGSNPSGCRAGERLPRDKIATLLHPVEEVRWVDCEEFLKRADLEFPTEAQWEYACRVGVEGAYAWGSDHGCLQGHENIYALGDGALGSVTDALWSDGFLYTAPVGSFTPNGFGLFDMHGNISEWCADSDQQEYPPDSDTPSRGLMQGGSSPRRAFRGGNWYLPPAHCRSGLRQWDFPNGANQNRGLRCARSVPLAGARGSRGDGGDRAPLSDH
ncbi:MAG: bifunctional serine/threonine-protein kinase/formylglycine-generating enzyme family protein [Planctomycetota bacterium]